MLPLHSTALFSIIIAPLRLLSTSVYFLLTTLFSSAILSPTRLRSVWFSRFWTYWGPLSHATDAPQIAPLISSHCASARLILDLGPAHGLHLGLFPPLSDGTRILGVEPNRACHTALRAAAENSRLEGVYEPLCIGAEDVKHVVDERSVDVILAVKVLCSVPRPRQTIGELYRVLKPGGRLIVYEHVRNDKYAGVRMWQWVLQRVWPALLAGCCVDRDTKKWLEEAGEWETVEWMPIEGAQEWETVPFVMGVLTKA